jgi:tRNA pseudouridine38-40 synthase
VPTFKLTIAYDGTNYCGWQVQVNGPTVQAAIERAVAQITGERIRVTGSGRTDSGVHALAQVAGFKSDKALAPEQWQRALNGRLPDDIRILDVAQLDRPFDPVRDCRGKRYRYVICDGRVHDVFLRHYRWHVPLRLDAQRMQAAGQMLVGRHDFASFQGAGSPRATTVRTIRELTVGRNPDDPHEVRLEVEADGFLYNMVRNIVGVLVDVGHGRLDANHVVEILAARDRGQARRTAPPEGLFLVRVDY